HRRRGIGCRGARGVQGEQVGRVLSDPPVRWWTPGPKGPGLQPRQGPSMTMRLALLFVFVSIALNAQAPLRGGAPAPSSGQAAKKKPAESSAARAARIHKEAIV